MPSIVPLFRDGPRTTDSPSLPLPRACNFQASRAWPTFCYRSFELPRLFADYIEVKSLHVPRPSQIETDSGLGRGNKSAKSPVVKVQINENIGGGDAAFHAAILHYLARRTFRFLSGHASASPPPSIIPGATRGRNTRWFDLISIALSRGRSSR